MSHIKINYTSNNKLKLLIIILINVYNCLKNEKNVDKLFNNCTTKNHINYKF